MQPFLRPFLERRISKVAQCFCTSVSPVVEAKSPVDLQWICIELNVGCTCLFGCSLLFSWVANSVCWFLFVCLFNCLFAHVFVC